jgi:hypothetical protein
MTLFGLLKRCTGYALPMENANAMAKFLMRVFHDFRQTISGPNDGKHFRHLDLKVTREPSRTGL